MRCRLNRHTTELVFNPDEYYGWPLIETGLACLNLVGNCLRGKETKDSWLTFNDDLIGAQEQSIAMCRKSIKCSRSPACMNMELLPELKHRKYIGGGSRGKLLGSMWSSRVQQPKTQVELKLARKMKDSKRGFCKYTISKRKAKESMVLLLTRVGDLATKGMEKDDVLNAFFCQVLLVRFACRLPRSLALYAEHDTIWYGIALWAVGVSCPGYVPSQLLVHLAEHGKLKSPCLVQQQLKHLCIINTVFSTNPKHSPIPATIKKIDSISAETRTPRCGSAARVQQQSQALILPRCSAPVRPHQECRVQVWAPGAGQTLTYRSESSRMSLRWSKLEPGTYKGRWRVLGWFTLEKRRVRGDVTALCSCLVGWYKKREPGSSRKSIMRGRASLLDLLRLNFHWGVQASEEPEKQTPVHHRHFYRQQHPHCRVPQLQRDTSCRLDIRKFFFTERVIKHWNRLPREVVESPSLEVFKGRLDEVLRDMTRRGEGDNIRLAREKLRDDVPRLEGAGASEDTRPESSRCAGYAWAQPKSSGVEPGDTEAIGAKREMPVKHLKAHKGCSSVKETQTAAQLKCLHTNARSMGNKQEELEATVHQENYDMVAITETWWGDSHNWSAAMDGYKLFRRDRRGRRGGGVALYVRERLDSLELNDGDDRVECLWVRIRGKANKADIVVGVCYRAPSQDEETDELFYKQLGEASRSLDLVLVGDFNIPDVCWKYNTAEKKQSRRFLECVADNFLTQLVREPTREGAPLGLLFTNREGLVSDVMVGGCLGQSDHEMIEFLIRGEAARGGQQNCHLGLPEGGFRPV
ncbi:hypothetical protein QYF61_011004 [Mycteria americana]|uniref:Endonuclease/exonuclease/phosphatase domain-containing protein n=1 Tax=Mycteria americana TaxID=33587 RepID=A0AAN7MYH5_MYCAM|nr:hypothetical protein QYF61_011004 [Mycteria americana]